MKDILVIGQSITNIKELDISLDYIDNTYKINKTNWLSSDNHNDTFEVTINNGKCKVKRTDTDGWWGMNLIIFAEVSKEADIKATQDDVDETNIPIMFINLEKDTDRLEHITNTLSGIFDISNIHKIEGVKHKIGMEGCRLAHIDANIYGINQRCPYYLVAEDDIQPLVDETEILPYIENAISENPDLVLFEQAGDLEINIKLNKVTNNLYRAYSGGQGAGLYLTSRKFGLQLVQQWISCPGRHIDFSWQDIWYLNNVYFHKPQLFHQKEGESNQHNVDYREASRPFDWNWYEKYNKFNKNNKINIQNKYSK
jgi:hypothetical protein